MELSVSKVTGWIYLLTILPRITHFTRVDTIKPLMRPVGLFFGLLTIMNVLNSSEANAAFFDASLFQNIFLFWFLINHERKEPLVLEKGMICFALGSVALALLFKAGIGIDYDVGRVRIFGDNSNGIGLRMSISMAILVLAVVQNKIKFGRLRYLLLIPLPLMLQLLFESGSRVALIAFVLAFVTGVVLLKTKRPFGKVAALLISVVVFFYGWQVMMESELLVNRLLESYYEGNMSGREIIWPTLLPLIESNPLFGVGQTGYVAYSEEAMGYLVSPHNVFLEVLCYTGSVGLIIYLIFLYRVSKRGYGSYKTEGLLLPLLLLFPVCGVLFSGQILVSKIGWCILAYITGSSVVNREDQT